MPNRKVAGAPEVGGSEGNPYAQQIDALTGQVQALTECLCAEHAARMEAEKRLGEEQHISVALRERVQALQNQLDDLGDDCHSSASTNRASSFDDNEARKASLGNDVAFVQGTEDYGAQL